MPDVVVVGAGVSGLVCASDLHEAGVDVVVLEASGRLGGRVHTRRHPGENPVELGAQWVADGHHQLKGLLARHGLRRHRPPRRGRAVHLDPDERHSLPAWRAALGQLTVLQTLDLLGACAQLSLRARRRPTRTDHERSAESWLGSACRTGAARRVLSSLLEAAACLPVSDVSLAWVLDQVRRCDGLAGLADTEQEVVVGGLGGLVDALAAPLTVHTLHPVRQLQRHDGRWILDTPAGPVGAGQVVLATPPSFTEHLLSDSSPSTVVPRRQPGAVLKVVATYARPFWRDRGLSGFATHESPTAVVTGTVDAGGTSPGSRGHLVGFVTGRAAQRLAGRPSVQQRGAVVGDLVRLHGPPAGRPLDLVVHDWSQETWTPGGYTWPVPPAASTEAAPLPDGLHLAGSENAGHWPGFVEGAVDAGHAAALAVLTARD